MRIIGIYFLQNSIIAPGRIKIKNDIITITNSLKNKFITPQIATYIYNKVLLSRIEYKLQTTFLTPNLLFSYQRIIDSTIKHKFSIEQTLPQKLFQNPYLFNIKTISNLQTEVLISNIQYKLSDPSISPYINQELHSIQINNCIPSCIFINPKPIFSITTNSFSIKLAHSYNISFCNPNICQHIISPQSGTTPLFTLFSQTQWKKCAPQLSKNKFFYLEQITSYNSNSLIKYS